MNDEFQVGDLVECTMTTEHWYNLSKPSGNTCIAGPDTGDVLVVTGVFSYPRVVIGLQFNQFKHRFVSDWFKKIDDVPCEELESFLRKKA